MKKMKLMTFDEWMKRSLKSPSFRKALEEPDEDPFLEVSYRLITLREKLGLTQAQAAKKVGTTQQGLARLESPNYRGHTLQSLNKIAQGLGKKLRIQFVDA